MKLNHMNLVVRDVAASSAFFEKHFGFSCQKIINNVIAILQGSDDFVLVLSNMPKTENYTYPSDFHIGFYRENAAEVNGILEKLKADGFAPEQEAKKIRDRFGFYFYGPGGILIEITCTDNESIRIYESGVKH